jgi:hypothetical protein
MNRDRVTSIKDLEPRKNKWIKVADWVDGITATAGTLAGVGRYKNAKEKTYF